VNRSGGEIVADEQVIDDELDLFGVQIDVAALPALETEISRGFGVDLGRAGPAQAVAGTPCARTGLRARG
jgi:hypothetical protein